MELVESMRHVVAAPTTFAFSGGSGECTFDLRDEGVVTNNFFLQLHMFSQAGAPAAQNLHTVLGVCAGIKSAQMEVNDQVVSRIDTPHQIQARLLGVRTPDEAISVSDMLLCSNNSYVENLTVGAQYRKLRNDGRARNAVTTAAATSPQGQVDLRLLFEPLRHLTLVPLMGGMRIRFRIQFDTSKAPTAGGYLNLNPPRLTFRAVKLPGEAERMLTERFRKGVIIRYFQDVVSQNTTEAAAGTYQIPLGLGGEKIRDITIATALVAPAGVTGAIQSNYVTGAGFNLEIDGRSEFVQDITNVGALAAHTEQVRGPLLTGATAFALFPGAAANSAESAGFRDITENTLFYPSFCLRKQPHREAVHDNEHDNARLVGSSGINLRYIKTAGAVHNLFAIANVARTLLLNMQGAQLLR